MKRKILDKIIQWDKSTAGKPLLITGAPGTGKTFVALDFATMFYENYIYINPKNDCVLRIHIIDYLQNQKCSIKEFLMDYYKIPLEWLSNILFIIDDFISYQCICDSVIQLIKEDDSLKIILLSSQYPNKKLIEICEYKKMSPMEFDEFLASIGSEWYTEIIRGHFQTQKKIPEIVHNEMLNLFRDYLQVGGMPEAVNEYIRSNSTENIPNIHRNIKYINYSQINAMDEGTEIRMRQILDSLPEQLLKDNKNFRYNLIRKGATHNFYSSALEQLKRQHLVEQILKADICETSHGYEFILHDNQYRLYAPEFAVLGSEILSDHTLLLNEPGESRYNNNDWAEEKQNQDYRLIDRILIENYLIQIISDRNMSFTFWDSGSLSKIDFIIKNSEGIIPIEIKLTDNSRTKSLSVFRNKYNINYSLKISDKNFETINSVRNIPFYAIYCIDSQSLLM